MYSRRTHRYFYALWISVSLFLLSGFYKLHSSYHNNLDTSYSLDSPPHNLETENTEHRSVRKLDDTEFGLTLVRNRERHAMESIPPSTLSSLYTHDKDLKTYKEFQIDSLVPFFPNETWRCNKDGTCYENWPAMEFPSFDRKYKNPCWTDQLDGQFKCFPHIHMVGWAKSGTTDMWGYWLFHPDLIKGYKETQFLTQFSFILPISEIIQFDNGLHRKQKEWNASHIVKDHKVMRTFNSTLYNYFKQRSDELKASPHKLMYDCTATTIYDNWHWKIKQGYQGNIEVPTHTNFHYLRKVHPKAQIIVMLRNPANRALSFYNHAIDMSIKDNANLKFKFKVIPTTPEQVHQFFVDSIYYFQKCVASSSLRSCCHMSGWDSQDWSDPEKFMTLRIGIYYVFLEEVFKNFPPEQVLLIKSEDFYTNTADVLTTTFQFLNISTEVVSHIMQQKPNIIMQIPKRITPALKTRVLLERFYAPFNERLSYMLEDNKWLKWNFQKTKK